MKRLAILGSTGSIGQNTLKVIDANPKVFRVDYLSAGQNVDLLIKQTQQYQPRAVAIADVQQYPVLKAALQGSGVILFAGPSGLLELIESLEVELAVNAIVGFAGLEPSYRILDRGLPLALSNKESIVMAGELIMPLAERRGGAVYPIDSEHSAIWQCLTGENPKTVKRLILTASGGPFRETPLTAFVHITPEDALKHPTWQMGRKITIDSATLMNKALEIIEARWLFDIEPANIDVVVHPQSIIHSMVEFWDGSIKAQLGLPDMKLPIQYALSYPERLPRAWEAVSFDQIQQWTFEPPDYEKFPALRLADTVLKQGGTAPAILNVVNEFAVYAFLERRIPFTVISGFVQDALREIESVSKPSLQDIQEIVRLGKDFVQEKVEQYRKKGRKTIC
jgi:1-deoxy-D-xylulose-5-phosphate reductoisomerase